MGDNRPVVYQEGDNTIYRASAIGGCLNALIAARLGFSGVAWPSSTEQVMAEGNLHEPDIVQRLAIEGHNFLHTGDDQIEFNLQIASRIYIRVHPDGINDKRVLEAKSMSQDVYKRWTASHDWEQFIRYAYQHSIEMLASDRKGLFACKNRNNGALDYIEVDDPPFSFNDIRRRVLTVEKYAHKGSQGLFEQACDHKMFPCPVFYLHPDKDEAEEVATTEDAVLDGLAQMYARAREEADFAERKREAARDRLITHLGETTKRKTAMWQVQRIQQKRTSLDKEALAKAVDLAPYTRTTVIEQLRVTEVKD